MIARILLDLRHRGAVFWLDGDRVRWRAPAGIIGPAELADLRAHRDDVFDLLDGIEERAAILQFDAGFSGAEAEASAWQELAMLASDAWQGAA